MGDSGGDECVDDGGEIDDSDLKIEGLDEDSGLGRPFWSLACFLNFFAVFSIS